MNQQQHAAARDVIAAGADLARATTRAEANAAGVQVLAAITTARDAGVTDADIRGIAGR